MEIKIDELLEAMKGYGADTQPVTIGILKSILIELKFKKEQKSKIQ